eukprot:COSAG05_NODE_2065_length_3619_cov_11.291824_7_plen_138_part_00
MHGQHAEHSGWESEAFLPGDVQLVQVQATAVTIAAFAGGLGACYTVERRHQCLQPASARATVSVLHCSMSGHCGSGRLGCTRRPTISPGRHPTGTTTCSGFCSGATTCSGTGTTTCSSTNVLVLQPQASLARNEFLW